MQRLDQHSWNRLSGLVRDLKSPTSKISCCSDYYFPMNFKSQILILSFAFAILNHSNDRKLYKRKLEKQGKDGQSRPWSRNGSRGSISDPENDIQTAPLGDDGHWTRWMANRNSPEGSEDPFMIQLKKCSCRSRCILDLDLIL